MIIYITIYNSSYSNNKYNIYIYIIYVTYSYTYMYIKCNIYIYRYKRQMCYLQLYIYIIYMKYKFNNKFNTNKTIVVKVRMLTTIIYFNNNFSIYAKLYMS